ncbi:MAG TPA: sugar phosphate nucleotidyltransferase, partial [Solirubrobacteraceae bacterium]|nr:sugar phosphate nucleotidyltransferase [Solirubrobacteraceae bacterium]
MRRSYSRRSVAIIPAVKPTVAILCGGRGTRLQEAARELAKPLVEIGGRPILWHVIQIYAAQGFHDFLLLTGHLSERVEAFVAAERWPPGVQVRCRYTGQDTPTGGRVAAAADELRSSTFCLTYADGLADLNLGTLLDYHRGHGAAATLTIVRPRLPFGVAQLNGDGVVRGFVEKPVSEHWVNGGFFCLEPSVLDRLGPESVLEREPLAGLAAVGQLRAFRHSGFWACMDTYKDALEL